MSNDGNDRPSLIDQLRTAREAAEAVERRISSRTTARRRATDPGERSSVTIRRRSILLVEDNPVLSRAIAGHLADEGNQVVAVSTLRDTRAQLKSRHFDALVLDLGLDGEFGADLLDELAQEPLSPAVVIISAFALAKVVAYRFDLEHLRKPLDLPELSVAIARAVERDRRPRRTA